MTGGQGYNVNKEAAAAGLCLTAWPLPGFLHPTSPLQHRAQLILENYARVWICPSYLIDKIKSSNGINLKTLWKVLGPNRGKFCWLSTCEADLLIIPDEELICSLLPGEFFWLPTWGAGMFISYPGSFSVYLPEELVCLLATCWVFCSSTWGLGLFISFRGSFSFSCLKSWSII